MVQEEYKASEEDMLEWYFAEGDDTLVEEKLDKQYPGLFVAFERIKVASKDGSKAFQHVKTAEDVRLLHAAVYADGDARLEPRVSTEESGEESNETEQKLQLLDQLDVYVGSNGREIIDSMDRQTVRREQVHSEEMKKLRDLIGLYQQINEELMQLKESGFEQSQKEVERMRNAYVHTDSVLRASIVDYRARVDQVPIEAIKKLESQCQLMVNSQKGTLARIDVIDDLQESRVARIPTRAEVLENRPKATATLIEIKVLDSRGSLD